MFKYIFLFVLSAAFLACEGDGERQKICDDVGVDPVIVSYCESDENFSSVPFLENISISRNQTVQMDSIRIKFSFQDGDGDIGFITLDSTSCNPCTNECIDSSGKSIFLTDTRTNCMIVYNLKSISKNPISISGKFNVVIPTICCIPPNGFACTPSTQYPLATVIFKVQIQDRAGNLSNELETPPIYLSCN